MDNHQNKEGQKKSFFERMGELLNTPLPGSETLDKKLAEATSSSLFT